MTLDYLDGGFIRQVVGDFSIVIASYATGAPFLGGLLGYDQGTSTTFTARYWDTETSGATTSVGGSGNTTSELQTPSDYTESDPNSEGSYADWNLNVDSNGDGSIDTDDIDPQRSLAVEPEVGVGVKPVVGYHGPRYAVPRSLALHLPPRPRELAGDLMVLHHHDQPGFGIELPVGRISRDALTAAMTAPWPTTRSGASDGET